ncbi:MAG: YraN family protein [Desulfotignum sp.]|nr:YraN family protein [Desulfotignum sp.]
MTRYRQELGRSGEKMAADHLAASGYTILETNYTTRFAEIDIIAAFEDWLVFVEVKTRTNLRKGLPREAVNAVKQHKIIQAAQQFLKTRPSADWRHVRFDVVEIYFGTHDPRINHISHAFHIG